MYIESQQAQRLSEDLSNTKILCIQDNIYITMHSGCLSRVQHHIHVYISKYMKTSSFYSLQSVLTG